MGIVSEVHDSILSGVYLGTPEGPLRRVLCLDPPALEVLEGRTSDRRVQLRVRGRRGRRRREPRAPPRGS